MIKFFVILFAGLTLATGYLTYAQKGVSKPKIIKKSIKNGSAYYLLPHYFGRGYRRGK